MISSISPRVFMSTPSAHASRHPRPVIRAASAEPPNLPRVATPITRPHWSQRVGVSRSPIWVRSPVYAK